MAVILVLLASVLVAYLPALHSGWIWDDDAHVTENPFLRDARGLAEIWLQPTATQQYYPLVFTSFWIERRVWGLHPFGFHLVNVLLHALSAFLLYRLLDRLNVPGALFAAALFALHPVQVESVAWVTERKNCLSGVFYLASALSFFRYRPPSAAPHARKGTARDWIASLLLFAAALLSKTVTATLPAALALVLWWKRPRLRGRELLPLLPFLALGVCMGLFTAWLEVHRIGASGVLWSLGPAQRLLVASRAFWFYLGKLLWPVPLVFIYPRWTIDAHALSLWLWPAAALALFASLWILRRRIGKGPLVAFLFFAGTLFPALGFFNVYPMRYSFVADHFQYLASIGPLALAAAGLHRIRASADLRVGLSLAVCIVLGVLTWRQGRLYHDAITLWNATLEKNPTCSIAHKSLGVILLDQGRPQEAEAHFLKTIDVSPEDPDAYCNLALLRVQQGNLGEAIRLYSVAVAKDSTYAKSYYNRSLAYFRMGRTQDAIDDCTSAIRCEPAFAPAWCNRGVGHSLLQEDEAALKDFNEAIRLKRDFPDAYAGRALVLYRLGEPAEARADFETCVRLGGHPRPSLEKLLEGGGPPGP